VSVDAGNTSKLGTDGKIFTPSSATPLPSDLVRGSVAGTATALILWTGTQAQYNAIATKSATTVYVVTGGSALLAEFVQNELGVSDLDAAADLLAAPEA
jgi:hypothetical protein